MYDYISLIESKLPEISDTYFAGTVTAIEPLQIEFRGLRKHQWTKMQLAIYHVKVWHEEDMKVTAYEQEELGLTEPNCVEIAHIPRTLEISINVLGEIVNAVCY